VPYNCLFKSSSAEAHSVLGPIIRAHWKVFDYKYHRLELVLTLALLYEV
jgi:hypothetical protein